MNPAFIVLRLCGLLVALAVATSSKANEATCGSLKNAFGPFDYRTATADQKALVESAHFPWHVEQLLRPATSEHFGHDIDYTLRAFPNHHRALLAMMKLSQRLARSQPPGAHYTIECYFYRAIRFQQNDRIPYMIAALYYTKEGKRDEALRYLDGARALADDRPNVHYDLGLLYMDLGAHDKALEHAKRAYEAGYPQTELRDRLRRAGVWKD
jgi:tetratricopeptide (TPR) repeat protein